MVLLAAGFDARAAAIVMNVVRAVASAGHTVMVTIHQPSINIFEAFDTLLLLQVSSAIADLKVWLPCCQRVCGVWRRVGDSHMSQSALPLQCTCVNTRVCMKLSVTVLGVFNSALLLLRLAAWWPHELLWSPGCAQQSAGGVPGVSAR